MFILLNGNQKRVLGLLRFCGLTENESKAYFVLLVVGRGITTHDLSIKAAIPRSKIYDVVDTLCDKELAEISRKDRPKLVSSKSLGNYIGMVIRHKQNEIKTLKGIENRINEKASALRGIMSKCRVKYAMFEPRYGR